MQRISDGLEVPRQMLDKFTGKSCGSGVNLGEVECELTYLPKSINHILVPTVRATSGYIMNTVVQSLAGNVVTLLVLMNTYYKTTSLGNAAAACNGSGGAGSHGTHGIGLTYKSCGFGAIGGLALDVIRIQYTVA